MRCRLVRLSVARPSLNDGYCYRTRHEALGVVELEYGILVNSNTFCSSGTGIPPPFSRRPTDSTLISWSDFIVFKVSSHFDPNVAPSVAPNLPNALGDLEAQILMTRRSRPLPRLLRGDLQSRFAPCFLEL